MLSQNRDERNNLTHPLSFVVGANIYISHGSFLHPRNPALCVSVTHIPIDYLSTIALHHRGALYVRLLIRIRQHEIEGGRAWKGMIEMIAARAPTRFQGLTTTPSLLRFGDKPSFLSANSKHWSLSRPSLDCSPLSSPVCKRVKRCPSPLGGRVSPIGSVSVLYPQRSVVPGRAILTGLILYLLPFPPSRSNYPE